MVSRQRRGREWNRVGVHRLAFALLATLAGVIALVAGMFWWTGLTLDFHTFGSSVWPSILLAVVWAGFALIPGSEREWFVPDTLAAFVIVALLTYVIAPGQYAAAALGMPLIDPWLAAADAWLGVHVPSLVSWTRAHPLVNSLLIRSYFTLIWQFLFVIPVLGFLLRDRDGVWEFAFHFYFCAVVTLLGIALIPAACAFQFYGFTSTIDQTRFIAHFNAAHGGALERVLYSDIEGLVSMPSFHVAGGLMVTWVVRRHWWLLVPLVVVNTMLVVSTFMTGAHYVIDTPVSMLMLAVSVLLYRRWGRRLLAGS